MDIAIITGNINNYEYYKEFTNVKDYNKIDWYYFTDNNIKSDFWKVININNIPEIKNINDNRLKIKYIKMNTHKILPKYKFFCWIDSSFTITNTNLIQEIFTLIKNNTLILYIHPSRFKERNIRGEIIRCLKIKCTNKENLKKLLYKQLKIYLDDKYSDKKGQLFCSGIIIKQNNLQINKMMELWYQHNILYTTRDQVSLPYIFWKTKVYPSFIIREHINLNTLFGKRIKKKR